MPEEKALPEFSEKSQAILSEIKALIAKNPVTLEYKDVGKIIRNSRVYDLRIRKDCDEFEIVCKQAIGYSIYITAITKLKEDPTTCLAQEHIFHVDDMANHRINKKLKRFNPWLGLMFLIEELIYQIEVGDFCDDLCD